MLKAFISRPYRPDTETLAHQIGRFLNELDIEAVDGKWPDASIPLRDDIVAKIGNCDVLVSMMFAGVPSSWVEQEIGVAIGLGLDVVQLTDGVQPRSGMLADHFQISFSDGEAVLYTALLATINKIKQRRYTSCIPTLSANAPLEEYQTEDWPPEACEWMNRLRGLFASSRFESCLSEAKRGFEKFPQCWRFLIAQSAALTHLNKLSEADKLVDKVVKDFAGEPRALSYALDNKEWVLSRRPGGASNKNLRIRASLLRRALQAERRLETCISLVFCFLQLNRIDKADREFIELINRFPISTEAFRQRVRLQGKEYIQAVAKSDLICGWLFPFEEVIA